MAGNIALPLQEFIASLNSSSLPRILQVCSGVYFQGSIYEISGSEVCFSTGDLIKVIGIELQSVCCEDICNNEKFELPINHTGLFKVVPEEMPYSSVEEMISLRPVELESCLPFTFTSHSKMTFGGLSLGANKALTVLSVERDQDEEDHVRCRVEGEQEASAEVRIPLSSRGEFYECESEECFTLKEIMSSPCLRSRRFRFVKTTKCERLLVLSPVYQVHAVMNLRKNLLKFPSSLEVDVVDVTDQCLSVDFVTPLSLTEVMSQPDESFPAVVEILEGPATRPMFICSWLPELNKEARLVFHKKATTTMILLSSSKSRKTPQYFLVSQQYGGKFRRRPREFNSVYELYVASTQTPDLKVSVTRHCEEIKEEGIPALNVGERLEIMSCTRMELICEKRKEQNQSVEALLCKCLQEPDDEDDDDEVDDDDGVKEVLLPLYMQGHFLEVLGDNKKYKLCDLSKNFSLPLDVRVVSRDTEMETDPLAGTASLRLEGIMVESTIQASFPHKPDCCFEIPAQWLSLSVSFTRDQLPWPQGDAPECHTEKVTEVTDAFFYEFHRKGNVAEPPPPRPPKRNLASAKSTKDPSKKPNKKNKANKSNGQANKSVPTTELSNLTLNNKKRPPAPPPPPDALNDEPPPIIPRKNSEANVTACKALPNTYVKMDQTKMKVASCDMAADVDSDHDYETVDESLVAMVKTAQESVRFY